MNQDILALMIFYGGLSVLVAGGLLYGLWEWLHWKKSNCIEPKPQLEDS